MRQHTVYTITILGIFSLFFISCATVPLTGRQQLRLIPMESMLTISFQQYDQFLETNTLSKDEHNTRMVKTVGERIQRAVERYYRENNMSHKLKGYAWEFNLVESDDVNAWCMPGGKVVIYTGILPYTKDESGLAVVIGHEVAHAIAEHGNERMSQMLFYQMGGMALGVAMAEKPAETQKLWMTAFGVGAQFGVILPYSRLHEREADHLGLVFMAMAGYDPNIAVEFWKRMARDKESSPPEFLSTHPSDETRINAIKKLIPEVMPYYTKEK